MIMDNEPGLSWHEKSLEARPSTPAARFFHSISSMNGEAKKLWVTHRQPSNPSYHSSSFHSPPSEPQAHGTQSGYKISFEISQCPDFSGVLVLYSPRQDATEANGECVCAVPNVPLRQSLSHSLCGICFEIFLRLIAC